MTCLLAWHALGYMLPVSLLLTVASVPHKQLLLPPANPTNLQEPKLNHVAVKEAVLPFDKFAGADTLLGPEMRSTGEVGGSPGQGGGWGVRVSHGAGMGQAWGSWQPCTAQLLSTLQPNLRPLSHQVMGIDVTFGKAYAKAAIAAGQRLPQSGNVFITMMDKYKEAGEPWLACDACT